jgi:hypothetical protein
MAHVIHSKTIDSKKTVNQPHNRKGNFIINAISSFKAKRRAVKIMKALNEAEQIDKGARKGRSLDNFLEEI